VSAFGLPRLALAVAAFILQTALLDAALPTDPEETSARPSLVGQVLVATPAMGDPRFERTVILMVQDGENGALGIILNKPVGEQTLASLLDAVGVKDAAATGSVRVFSGGPVQPEVGFVVHSAEYRRPETIGINDRLSMTSSVSILRDIGEKNGPGKVLVAFGYAGWGRDQLGREIDAGAWVTAEADPALVFDADRDNLWDDAWKHRTQHL
jgi:putative transcriptional regulator